MSSETVDCFRMILDHYQCLLLKNQKEKNRNKMISMSSSLVCPTVKERILLPVWWLKNTVQQRKRFHGWLAIYNLHLVRPARIRELTEELESHKKTQPCKTRGRTIINLQFNTFIVKSHVCTSNNTLNITLTLNSILH